MGASNKICPRCGKKMKQQFIGLQHCKCGISWKRDQGYFERTPDMVFCLQRKTINGKTKQFPVIRFKGEDWFWHTICRHFAPSCPKVAA